MKRFPVINKEIEISGLQKNYRIFKNSLDTRDKIVYNIIVRNLRTESLVCHREGREIDNGRSKAERGRNP